MNIPNTWIVGSLAAATETDPQESSRTTISSFPHQTDVYTSRQENALAEEIRSVISGNPNCKILSDSERAVLINSILRDSSFCTSQSQMPRLTPSGTEPASASKAAKTAEPDDLTCEEAIQTNQKIQQVIRNRCTRDNDIQDPPVRPQEGQSDNGFSGPDWFTGGGIVASIIAILRFIRQWRKVGREMEEAGQSVGILAKGLAVLNKEMEALMNVGKETMRITRKFFGETLVDFGKTLWYVVSFGWLRKKKDVEKKTEPAGKPEEDQSSEARRKLRQTNPWLIPARPASVDVVFGEPRLSVVLSQISGWQDDKELSKLGKRFSALDNKAQLYIAYEAIRGWYALTSGSEEDQQAAQDYVASSLPLYGGLPGTFLKLHVSAFLEQKRDSELQIAADEWAKDTAKKMAGDIKPLSEEVERQFVTDMRIASNSDLLRFMAGMAIEEWNSYNIHQKASFITDITQSIEKGQLPAHFIRVMKRATQNLVPIYLQLLEIKPEIRRFPFAIINSRVKLLFAAWENLPKNIKKEFTARTDDDKPPQTFVELLKSSLTIGTSSRGEINRSNEQWTYVPKSKPEEYKDVDLDLAKLSLVNGNSDLAWYPRLLEVRSRALIDDWQNLPANIKEAFSKHDKRMGSDSTLVGVSVTYTKLWSRINSGIGVAQRPPLPPKENGPGNGGTGGTSSGSGGSSTPSDQTGGLPAPSSPMQGMPFSIVQPVSVSPPPLQPLSGASVFMPLIPLFPTPVVVR